MKYRIKKVTYKQGNCRYYPQECWDFWPDWIPEFIKWSCCFGGEWSNSFLTNLPKAQKELKEYIERKNSWKKVKIQMLDVDAEQTPYDNALEVIEEIKNNRDLAVLHKDSTNDLIKEFALEVIKNK